MTQADVYKRGLAIGRSDIVSDCWHFRFYEDVFTVNLRNLKTSKYRGYIVAKIKDVKAAAAAAGQGAVSAASTAGAKNG